jgi:hypothetical protein
MDELKRFEDQDLQKGVFRNCRLAGATFNDVDLSDAVFSNVSLRRARFTNVNLAGAEIDDANIDGLKVFGHDIQGSWATLSRIAGFQPARKRRQPTHIRQEKDAGSKPIGARIGAKLWLALYVLNPRQRARRLQRRRLSVNRSLT